MTVIKELFAVLGVQVDKQSLDAADQAIDRLRSTAAGAAKVFAAAGGALALFAARFSASARETQAWAERIGIGVDQLTELDYAAAKVTGSSEGLREALTDLAEKASDVFRNDPTGTSDAAESFKALGISVRDGAGRLKPTIQLFEEAADALSRMEHRGDATGVAMRLFGDDVGRKMAPFLFQGRDALRGLREEARLLGATLDAESVRKAASVASGFSVLRQVGGALGTRILGASADAINRVVDGLLGWVAANRAWIETEAGEAIAIFLRILRGVAIVVASAVTAFRDLANALGGTRRIAAAVGVVLGVVLLSQLGSAAIAVARLAAAFFTLTAAQATAAIGPIAVGAALVLLALLVEDLIVTVRGGESVIRHLYEAAREFAEYKPGDSGWLRFLRDMVKRVDDVALGFARLYSLAFGSDAEKRAALDAIFGGYLFGGDKSVLPDEPVRIQNRFRSRVLVPQVAPAPPQPLAATATGGGTTTISIQNLTLPSVEKPGDFAPELQRGLGLRPGRTTQ